MNKSTTVPHPPWAIYAMRVPCVESKDYGEIVCREDALANCPRGLTFGMRYIAEENAWEWYAPEFPPSVPGVVDTTLTACSRAYGGFANELSSDVSAFDSLISCPNCRGIMHVRHNGETFCPNCISNHKPVSDDIL